MCICWMNCYEENWSVLTHKQLETLGCILSTVATDALVLKHQAISIYNAEKIIAALQQFHTKTLQLQATILENNITFWKKYYPVV